MRYLIELHDEGISLTAPIDEEEARRLPNARWSSEDKVWVFPLSWASCVAARAAFEEQLEVGPGLQSWARAESEKRVDPAMQVRDADDGPEFTPATPGDPDDMVDTVIGPDGEVKYGRAGSAEAEWWWDIWRGMPTYLNRDIFAWRTMKVHFRDVEDLKAFGRAIGLPHLSPQTKAVWYPPMEEFKEDHWRWSDRDSDITTLPEEASAQSPKLRPKKAKVQARTTKVRTMKKKTAARRAPAGPTTAIDRVLEELV